MNIDIINDIEETEDAGRETRSREEKMVSDFEFNVRE